MTTIIISILVLGLAVIGYGVIAALFIKEEIEHERDGLGLMDGEPVESDSFRYPDPMFTPKGKESK